MDENGIDSRSSYKQRKPLLLFTKWTIRVATVLNSVVKQKYVGSIYKYIYIVLVIDKEAQTSQ